MVMELFKMYDADGSGELDRDEFIAVLMQTGISSISLIKRLAPFMPSRMYYCILYVYYL